jgi:hypothetical protein
MSRKMSMFDRWDADEEIGGYVILPPGAKKPGPPKNLLEAARRKAEKCKDPEGQAKLFAAISAEDMDLVFALMDEYEFNP